MIYKDYKCGSYNIHTIKTNSFKTVNMEIIFRNNIDPSTVAEKTLLFDMLMENSKKYKTKQEIAIRQEELYSSYVYSYSSRLGNEIYSSVCLDFLNEKYTDESILEDIIKFPFELILEPNITNNEFDSNTLRVVKERRIAEIESIKESPQTYAIYNSLKAMDKDSISSKNIQGTKEEIDSISPSSLYNTYINTLKHDYIDIFISGDIDEDKIINIINKYAAFDTIKNHELELYVNNKTKNKVLEEKEESTNQQSQIVYLYNVLDLTDFERKYTMNVYNQIFGGGSLETKLYQNLRDKNSLCYSVRSIYQKYDNLLMVITGVDKKKISKAKEEINNTIKEMNESVTQEELDIAISSIISSIRISEDSPGSILDNYLFHSIGELDLIDDRVKNYKKVTLEDINKLNKKIELNTIYVLEGE